MKKIILITALAAACAVMATGCGGSADNNSGNAGTDARTDKTASYKFVQLLKALLYILTHVVKYAFSNLVQLLKALLPTVLHEANHAYDKLVQF